MKLEEAIKFGELGISPKAYLALAIITSLVLLLLSFPFDPLFSILLFLSSLTLFFGFPYFQSAKKIDTIERNFPDALKQLAGTLRAGSTIEYALQDVADAKYPYLSDEVRRALKGLREGLSFEEAIERMAERTKSDIVRRATRIIISAKKAGASLSKTLEALASDISDVYRLKKEREVRTAMPVWFIRITSGFLGPMVFGMTVAVISRLGSGQIALDVVFKIFLIVEAAFGAAIASLMKFGNVRKGIIQVPLLALCAYLSYVFGKLVGFGMMR